MSATAAPTDTSRMLLDLQPGERLSFAGTRILVEFIARSGRAARLCVVAPRTVKIERSPPAVDTSMAGSPAE